MSEIIFDHVTKMFGEEVGVEDITFRIEKGEFVFLIGKSGAGKSTLLRLMMKQIDATDGKITIRGKRLDLMQKNRIPYHRRRIGIMTPDIGLLKDRSVYENIAFAIRAVEKATFRMRSTVMNALGKVGIAGKVDAYPDELSGGEQARVLLARALCVEPEIIIADEPTANLDPDAAWDLMQLFDEINHQGMTVVIASQSRELVTIMKKRCMTIVAGALVADEKNAIYNYKALDIFEERRILEERQRKRAKKS